MPEVADDRVLEYLSRSYLELINSNSSQNVFYIDTDNTDPLPILNTNVGKMKYILDDSTLVNSNGDPITSTQLGVDVTARKLRSIFIEGRVYGLETYQPKGVPSVYAEWYRQRTFSKIPCQSYNQRGGQAATILLFNDYDSDIFVEFYYTPGDLTTNKSIMLIDTDQWSDALIDGAVGYYEDVINAKSERLAKFQSYWKRAYLNVGLDNLMDKIPNNFKSRSIG